MATPIAFPQECFAELNDQLDKVGISFVEHIGYELDPRNAATHFRHKRQLAVRSDPAGGCLWRGGRRGEVEVEGNSR